MKLYLELLKLLFAKLFLRRPNGELIRRFAERMGIVYIKMAQMLATQNFGNLFTEEDRLLLSSICDNCNPISLVEVMTILRREYGDRLEEIFAQIDETPVGSASVSQVHRAILQTGETVAIKIKRQDVTETINRDLKTIRKLTHRFGKFVKFRNFAGSDHALDLYLEWIKQETDFLHEQANIKTYQTFANNINGKVKRTKKVKIPKLYEEFCTENIIVMEFVKSPTVNKLPLTPENKAKITTAFNSYIQLSFWALFNDQPVVFHGDPHSGNLSIDDNGDLWFIDMGLLCALAPEDAKLCRDFFLTAYAGNYEKLYAELVAYGEMDDQQKRAFKADCQRYCATVRQKEVTYYFIDMVNICLSYEIVPPNFLFNMAKAFVCLNGISNFTDNNCTARELLAAQTVEFLLKRSLNDCKDLVIDGISIVPKVLTSVFEQGIISTFSEFITHQPLEQTAKNSLDHLKEAIDLMSATYLDQTTS